MFPWLGNMAGWLSGWMFHPWTLMGGALLISSPIIIHLLNRQRFKIVDWAAMDFLLQAEKRNRYRIILEDLVLLALRCLAVLLAALLLARAFLPTGLTKGLIESVSFERVVLLDDSLSMNARTGSRTAMDDAKEGLIDFVRSLAGNGSDDSLTLMLTSRPDQPVFHGKHLDDSTVDEVVREIDGLKTSDLGARLDAALLAVEKQVLGRSGEVNRVVYVIGDMRWRDWASENASEKKNSVAAVLARLSRQVNGCYVVDVATDRTSNLVVQRIQIDDKVLAAGVATKVNVGVRNAGPQDVTDVEVKFTAGQSPPLVKRIESIRAGEPATVSFTYTFTQHDEQPSEALEPVEVRAAVSAGQKGAYDHLADDDVRYCAARVVRGIPTLIVDGDPSAVFGRRESFHLEAALAPPGDMLSGVSVSMVTDTQFETVRLEDYQVIFLCNVYRVGEDRRSALDAWVRRGGGLVLMLGDQVDEQLYNAEFYREGNGLSPLKLAGIRGDESERRWVHFRVEEAKHPVLRVFEGENNPFIDGVMVFRWWAGTLPGEGEKDDTVRVPARFTDVEDSPAMVEKAVGDGRVLVMPTPADGDWSSWPAEPSYLVAMQEVLRYMAPESADEGNLFVGNPIHHPLELTRYEREVTLIEPDGTALPMQATEGHDAKAETLWQVDHADTGRCGFYELDLVRKDDGGTEKVLFAANIDPDEGDLLRMDRDALQRALGDAPVRIVSGNAALSAEATGAKWEIWPWVLGALVGLLCLEQLLGWVFGRRRQESLARPSGGRVAQPL